MIPDARVALIVPAIRAAIPNSERGWRVKAR